MPEMNGIEACKIIRNHANEQIKSTPIIALTAATMDNEKSTLIELGMNDYISKPFNPSDLYNKIYQHIRQDE
jgi:CheY-like chemotaxis protein